MPSYNIICINPIAQAASGLICCGPIEASTITQVASLFPTWLNLKWKQHVNNTFTRKWPDHDFSTEIEWICVEVENIEKNEHAIPLINIILDQGPVIQFIHPSSNPSIKIPNWDIKLIQICRQTSDGNTFDITTSIPLTDFFTTVLRVHCTFRYNVISINKYLPSSSSLLMIDPEIRPSSLVHILWTQSRMVSRCPICDQYIWWYDQPSLTQDYGLFYCGGTSCALVGPTYPLHKTRQLLEMKQKIERVGSY